MATKELGGRQFEIGVLSPESVKVHPEPSGAYYSLLEGKNPDGETRYVTTRGAGKQWGATRVPLQVPARIANELGLTGADYATMLRNLFSWYEDVYVLLVQMPREGNVLSGLEWNAPGGTGELGETPTDIADREFDEESGLTPLWTGSDMPEWNQFASGCYDEVQSLSLAIVTGNPTRLVEGAIDWTSVPLSGFLEWQEDQNQTADESLWAAADRFCPVDGKVGYVITRLLLDLFLPLVRFEEK